MTCGKKTLFAFLLGIDLLATILEFTHNNFLGISTLLSFCTCLLLPGFLISLILRLRKISFWENLLFIVGFSIAFLEFGGLLLNMLFPLFGIHNPLTFQHLAIGFALYNACLFIFAWIRTKPCAMRIQLPRRSKIEKLCYVLPVCFPVLATLGAIVLNNGGSDILTLILLGTIAFYSLFLLLFHKNIAVDLYPYALFLIAVASLFTTSLRSWYITGHDIETEFYVFQLTNTHHIWRMAFFQDPYNACLSITILPTILTNLLSIQDMYIYKVIFQILFATSPVLVFFILRNYTTPVLSFLSAFLFMVFPTFFTDMPMLNRQEIGFIFFGLALYMLLRRDPAQQAYRQFEESLSKLSSDLAKAQTLSLSALSSDLSLSMRRILFTVFALSVIVSHYSTNFVLLVLVACVYISTLIISLPLVKKTYAWLFSKSRARRKNTFSHTVFLSLPLVLILFGMTYAWNTLYTHSSSHADSVVVEVINSIFVTSNSSRSSDLSDSIFFATKPDAQQELQNYIRHTLQVEGTKNTYSQSITRKYPSSVVPQEELAPTPLGNVFTAFHIPVFNIQAELRSLTADCFQIFVLVGLLIILFSQSRKTFDQQYLFLCFCSIFLLALITVLPELSVEYGVLRMFQQFLFLLSLPMVLCLRSMFFFVKEQKRIMFTGIIIAIFFLNLTGFLSHLTGDYYPQMTLDNAGLYYDAYYVTDSDTKAIAWLSQHDVNDDPVVTDLSGVSKLHTYGGIDATEDNFPALVRKNEYVYLDLTSNTVFTINSDLLIYNSDKKFLDDNKDLIYSNGTNNVYK